jgi:hypothetical protein
MATWKKVIVSGSNAILNQVTASGGFSGDGSGLTGISADSLGNSLTDGNGIADFTFNGSAGATVAVQADGLTLTVGAGGVKVADGGITTTQIGANQVTNAKLENDGITIAGVDTSLGGSITAATIGNAIGAFSGSAQVTGITVGQMAAESIDSDQYVDGSIDTAHIGANQVTNAKLENDGITIAGVDTSLGGSITAATIGNAIGAFSGSAQVTGITVGQMAAESIDSDQYVDGSIDTDHIGANQVTNAKLANSAITIAGASTSLGGSITAAAIGNAIGAFSGSAQVTGITVGQMAANSVDTAQIVAGAVETAKINDLAVTTAKIADNAVTGDKLSDDVTIANNLTVTGDLIVNGATTTLSTTNLSIEDKFITIASGSQSATDGGIIVSKQANGSGFAFGYDASLTKWVLQNNAAVGATTLAPDAFIGIVSASAAVPTANPAYGGATGYGNIHVKTDTGDIYIYS